MDNPVLQLVNTPADSGYFPVIRLALWGEHSGNVLHAFSNYTDSPQKRSIFGVLTGSEPAYPSALALH